MVDVLELQRRKKLQQQKAEAEKQKQTPKSENVSRETEQKVVTKPVASQSSEALDAEKKRRQKAERELAELRRQMDKSAKVKDDKIKQLSVSNERLATENDRLRKISKVEDATIAKNTFNGIFQFHGQHTQKGPRGDKLFTNLKDASRVYLNSMIFGFLSDFMAELLNRRVLVDKANKVITKTSSLNVFLRRENKTKMVAFAMLALSLTPDDLVAFGYHLLHSERTELAAQPSKIKDLEQGASSSNDKTCEGYDFYIAALAYRDLITERENARIGRDDILAVLIDIQKQNDKVIDNVSDVYKDVRASEVLTALQVARDLGIHRQPLQANMSVDALDSFLAYKVENSEEEIVKNVVEHARDMSQQVDRREYKARQGFH